MTPDPLAVAKTLELAADITPGTRVELVGVATWPIGARGVVIEGRIKKFNVVVELDCAPGQPFGFHEHELRVAP